MSEEISCLRSRGQGLEGEWGRRSRSNIRHPNIVPCFIFFHTAVFKSIKTNFKSIHQSHRPLGTKETRTAGVLSMYRHRYLWEGKGCMVSVLSMRFQGILCEISRSKLAISVHHLQSSGMGMPGKIQTQ